MMRPTPRGRTLHVRMLKDMVDRLRQAGGPALDGEPVTPLDHGLQTAALAVADRAPGSLVAAALLHDIGRLITDRGDLEFAARHDSRHQDTGALYLARWFGPEVTEPVQWHVDAKRYLATTEDRYLERLTPASTRRLGLQGGPMTAEETELFRSRPCFESAVRLRRWDDGAKERGTLVAPLETYLPLLEALVR